jgi:hypothetical protein
MHSSLVEKFSKLVSQLITKQHYGGKEYCVRLDKFEKGVVETIEAINGAYYLSHGAWWIIDANFYDQLINQIKVRFPQFKLNDQLDKMETP